MSAQPLLDNPTLFMKNSEEINIFEVMREYMNYCKMYTPEHYMIKAHLFHVFQNQLSLQTDLRQILSTESKEISEFEYIINELEYRFKNNIIIQLPKKKKVEKEIDTKSVGEKLTNLRLEEKIEKKMPKIIGLTGISIK
jgi:hypothetical protein